MNIDGLFDEDDEDEPFIRPFILTGGRTIATLPVEALAVSSSRARSGAIPLSSEQRQIVMLCESPHAIAEVSAKLGFPLGVARVLVADLAEHGLLHVSQEESVSAELNLVERLINGIRRR
jgi:hypothetical protein